MNSESGRTPELEALSDALPTALLVMDRQGRIVLANTRVSHTLGTPPDERLDGRQMWQALPAGLRETVAAMQREVLIYGTEAQREFELILSDGSRRFLDLQLSPVAGKSDQPDFFSLSMTEADERQEVVELKKLDHLKSNFLSLISHELRTPLTSIRGAVHLLGESCQCGADPEKTLVGIIQGNSDRLIRLVNNLLEMVAIDNETFVINRAPNMVGPLVTKALEKSRACAQAKFVGLSYAGQDGMADVDPERFMQFISYLVDNAIKFTPTGGRIVVTTSFANDGGLDVSVKDSGCGVPTYAREKIFDRFYQVEDPMTRCCGGAGVGLYLARHIALCHGGRVWVDSHCSDGSDFHAFFPVASAAGSQKPPTTARQS